MKKLITYVPREINTWNKSVFSSTGGPSGGYDIDEFSWIRKPIKLKQSHNLMCCIGKEHTAIKILL